MSCETKTLLSNLDSKITLPSLEKDVLLKKLKSMIDGVIPPSADMLFSSSQIVAGGPSAIADSIKSKMPLPTEAKALTEKVIESGMDGVASSAASAGGMHGGNASAQEADLALSDSHNTQDAEVDFGWTSMIHPDVKYTTLEPLMDAKYSISEDYPTSRGEIDQNKNFWKHNYTTGEWWDCHHSGYLRKVDNAGNYETKIPGTELYYTIGDRGNVCASNVDNLIMQNKYNHVMQEQTEIVDGNLYNTYNMNVFETILLTQVELIGMMRAVVIGINDSLTIGGNWSVNVGGNITIKAGGTIDIDGAQILLN